jgi:hypothetical protein
MKPKLLFWHIVIPAAVLALLIAAGIRWWIALLIVIVGMGVIQALRKRMA